MKPWNYHTARDLQLPMQKRWASIRREDDLASHCVHAAAWHAFRLFLRLYEHLEVRGREHIPSRPPFVLVANHSSHLDALALGSSLPRGQLGAPFPVAASDTFFTGSTRCVMSALFLNALPFKRRACSAHSLETLRERLKAKEACLILFPEGTRSRDGAVHSFKCGIGALVAGTTVPVVPCAISGAFEAWPPDSAFPDRGHVCVNIGRALRFESVANDREGWREVANQLEARVRQLLGNTQNGGHDE